VSWASNWSGRATNYWCPADAWLVLSAWWFLLLWSVPNECWARRLRLLPCLAPVQWWAPCSWLADASRCGRHRWRASFLWVPNQTWPVQQGCRSVTIQHALPPWAPRPLRRALSTWIPDYAGRAIPTWTPSHAGRALYSWWSSLLWLACQGCSLLPAGARRALCGRQSSGPRYRHGGLITQGSLLPSSVLVRDGTRVSHGPVCMQPARSG
jgi:hypothetical protein